MHIHQKSSVDELSGPLEQRIRAIAASGFSGRYPQPGLATDPNRVTLLNQMLVHRAHLVEAQDRVGYAAALHCAPPSLP
ncbi:MAG: hypothetical protein ABI866_06755 [Dokdonella sp.]